MASRGPVVLFRVDASVDIGSGHVMRCLTLAGELAASGHRCIFVSRLLPGHLHQWIRESGFEVIALEEPRQSRTRSMDDASDHRSWLGVPVDVDAHETVAAGKALRPLWCVVDHYALDARWEAVVAARLCQRILVIDDLADRSHAASILVDQNLGRRERDYQRWVPTRTRVLAGPRYALLRREFAEQREASLRRRAGAPLRRILVSMGGMDRDNVTGKVLTALARPGGLPAGVDVVVLMGGRSPALAAVETQLAELPFATTLVVDSRRVAELLRDTDLAIGAAGSAAWERCCLGVPSLLLVLALNQRGVAAALHDAGAAVNLGERQLIDDHLAATLRRLSEQDALTSMSERCAALVDGLGAERVAAAMNEVLDAGARHV